MPIGLIAFARFPLVGPGAREPGVLRSGLWPAAAPAEANVPRTRFCFRLTLVQKPTMTLVQAYNDPCAKAYDDPCASHQ